MTALRYRLDHSAFAPPIQTYLAVLAAYSQTICEGRIGDAPLLDGLASACAVTAGALPFEQWYAAERLAEFLNALVWLASGNQRRFQRRGREAFAAVFTL